MALTEQKRRYAESRLSGLSMKASAIAAGCPEKTASQAGSRLEKDPDVAAAMKRLTAPATKQELNKNPVKSEAEKSDPLAFFEALMNDPREEAKLRLEAARSLAAYTLPKPGDIGKKKQAEDAAKKAREGRFSPSAPPPSHLRSVK